MAMPMITYTVFVMCLMFYVISASDPGPLQDFCIGETNPYSGVFVNGYLCKNPKNVTTNDFIFTGFDTVGDTNNPYGSKVSMVNSTVFPALNTMALTIARVDFKPGGINALHLHPRSSEIFTVLEGTLYAGVVTTNLQTGGNKLYAKVLNKGDIFVFPQGLIHFQVNIGKTHAMGHAIFASQNPGVLSVARAVFGSTPSILDSVLTKAFQVDDDVIDALRSPFYNVKDRSQGIEIDL